jgi:molybdopterin-containing oxidoreductase family membrane subunit
MMARPESPLLSGAAVELRAAAVRPMVSTGRRFWLVAGLLALAAAGGVAAFAYQQANGLAVTGLNDQVFWGIYTASLVTFIGFSYGGALVSAVLRLTNASWRGPVSRIAEATALATILVGALFPIIHLGRPERFWEMLARPNIQSPIFWDMVAILTYLVATLVLFSLPLIPDLAAVRDDPRLGRWRKRSYRLLSFGWAGTPDQRRTLDRALMVLAILIVPLAVVVHTVLSYAFSLTSRPGWHSTIFGPYFVIGAIYSGVAVVILAALAYRTVYHLERWIDARSIRNLAYVMVVLGVAYAYSTFSEITTEGFVSEQADVDLLYGLVLARYAPLFWTFVIAGLVVPLALVALPRTRTPLGIGVAAALVVAAMYIKRFLIVVPPQTRPVVGGEAGAYVPSWVELTIVVGAAAGIVLIVMLLFRFVPVLSIDEMEAIEGDRAEEAGQAGRTPGGLPLPVKGVPQ